MIGQAKWLYGFIEGSQKRFDIPVYQRNYNWKREQCVQLFNDLVDVHKKGKRSHFFGSIVSENKDDRKFTIIDGQQRLTTVSLIMIAMVNAVKKGVFTEEIDIKTSNFIKNNYIVAEEDEVNKLRLRPYNNDKEAFSHLVFDPEEMYKEDSNITINYRYFYERITEQRELTIKQLRDAIEKLQIISIELNTDLGDDPQLIFESLNSTGLALTESDKIRNYILMGKPSDIQEALYNNYWYKIEHLTGNKLDDFIFNYLMIYTGKVQATKVYKDFKEYAKGRESEAVLADMLHYAEIYNTLRQHTMGDAKANEIKERIDRLGLTVIEPFLMSYLDFFLSEHEPADELVKVLSVLETYLFRRIICGEPSNVLRNMFAALHGRVLALKKDSDCSYSSVLIYLLDNIQAKMPDDKDFAKEFGTRDVYHLKPNVRSYLFDRLERMGNAETINIYNRLQKINLSSGDKPFSVEHIMPQTLTAAWVRDLGVDQSSAVELHAKWLHTIANLTVTAYNSELSNAPFGQKKEVAFNEGSIRLNEFVRSKDKWTEEELEERKELLVKTALEIWGKLPSDYVPRYEVAKQITLDYEDFDYTYKQLRCVYMNGTVFQEKYMEWKKAIVWIYKQLFNLDAQPLYDLAEDSRELYFTKTPDNANTKLAEGLYVYLNNDTNTKVRVLRNVVKRFYAQDDDESNNIVFEIKSDNQNADGIS